MTEQTPPKLSPAQERSLLSGLANTKTRVLEGRPVTNRALVRLGLAYHAPTFMEYRLTEAGLVRAQELRDAQRAEQFKEDAAAVEEFRPKGTRPVYARDIKEDMIVHDGALGFRTVVAVKTFEEGPFVGNHWTRVTFALAEVKQADHRSTSRTSEPTFIYFVKEEPQPRPAAEVLGADPIPADTSVLVGMPGDRIGRDGVRLSEALTGEAYVVQLRSKGVWILPNHDDSAHVTRGQVVGAAERVRRSAPDHARASVDTDGTLYVSNGWQSARYIPATLFEGYRADTCPGCGTAYATNGDGPCKEAN
ncbi:hypothetical protein [Streptomyces sp. NPDC058252]|uniref:hypothetical protein n=1 Tax=Streptomyces sp. NPDC058252 TaxID=3346405 RepID=UPI0036E5E436